jgi:hypothetical protein
VQDFYIWVKGSWIFMEIATVAAGVVALRYYRFASIVAIIAVALWFMSMDLAPWFSGTTYADFETRRRVSVWFGLAVLAVAWIVDYRSRNGDFAFWLHLFGLMAFWGGITASSSSTELGKAVYCLLNVGLIVIAVILMRRAYAVFGAFGQAHLGQQLAGLLRGLLAVHAPNPQGHGHVVQRAELGQQVVKLIHKTQVRIAQPANGCRVHVRQGLAHPLHAALAGRVQTAQQVQQGAFARTRSAHDGQRVTSVHLQVDIAQHGHVQGAL